ncbi:MAG: hypothetical protein OEX77_00825 [Candidatus Bathyarchaeota archaeon]|nr:hypothetical protein [Candidatus Bathyarchaeota archaeon]MDH5732448.1 hypothetical protein [Candidatus Bathyarchaeota archaeon]
MVDGTISIKKVVPLIVVTWILSLATTLTVVYVVLSISPSGIGDESITTEMIADSAIVTTKLADGTITSAKILDGAVTTVDLDTGAVAEIQIRDGAVTTTKITDYAVTNLKLAANAIPFNSTYGTESITKTTASWENITDLSVTMTLERNSTLLIMFSVQSALSDPDKSVIWRAFVNTDTALPGSIYLQPPGEGNKWSSISYNFYKPDVSTGEYTIYVQWYVSGGTAWIANRVLFVIALPT